MTLAVGEMLNTPFSCIGQHMIFQSFSLSQQHLRLTRAFAESMDKHKCSGCYGGALSTAAFREIALSYLAC